MHDIFRQSFGDEALFFVSIKMQIFLSIVFLLLSKNL
jgi:hypothetical protein